MRNFFILSTLVLTSCATQKDWSQDRYIQTCTEVPECAHSVRTAISGYWSRPVNFEGDWREMEVVVRIELDDVFNLISFDVIQSSGYQEFDNSAIQAILKAQPFIELKGLSYEAYSRYFQRFTITFRPEDLFDT